MVPSVNKFFIALLPVLLLVSCAAPHPAPGTNAHASSLYCEVLNLSPRPYPVLEPKSYLGCYLDTKAIEEKLPGCAENQFIEAAGIMPGSPAARAGIRKGDVILSVDGKPTCGSWPAAYTSFKKNIEEKLYGTPAVLDILRGNLRTSVTVTLEAQPFENREEARHPDADTCGSRTSLIEESLQADKEIPARDTLLDGLYRRSNLVHEPGVENTRRSDVLQLKEVTYLMRHPFATGKVAKDISESLTASLDGPRWQVGPVYRKTAAILGSDLSSEATVEITFPALISTIEAAGKQIQEAVSALSPDEQKLLRDHAIDPDSGQWNQVLAASMKVDRTKLFQACAPLTAFLTRDNLARLKEDVIKRFGAGTGILYQADTPIGKVIVGGTGPNVYTGDAALILDLGGDDLYLNNAGGTRPGMPVSLVIDWGGNDRYLNKEPFSQGAGLLGCGMLVDLGGEDTFSAGDGSQGSGFWGVGLLYHGDGNSVLTASRYSQGTGQMGIGLTINGTGNDRYSSSIGGQGLGLFGGAGILIDRGGNDSYELGGREPDERDPAKSTVSFGQGFGMGVRPEEDRNGSPGGIGMLIDEAGDDTYLADYFSQGASYYYGLGILDDHAGNDEYVSGRYSQGAGIHSSIGALIDRGGSDFYYASFGVGQGMGHDFGVGYFEDDDGENRFWGGTLVQGAATNGGIGICIDLDDKGQRTAVSRSQAYGEETGMGIMVSGGPDHHPAVAIGVKKR